MVMRVFNVIPISNLKEITLREYCDEILLKLNNLI